MSKKLKRFLILCLIGITFIPNAYTDDCETVTSEWLECVSEGCSVQIKLIILMDIEEFC
jgi:hypothetical protein